MRINWGSEIRSGNCSLVNIVPSYSRETLHIYTRCASLNDTHFLHILSIFRAIYRSQSKRKRYLALASIYGVIYVHPEKSWSVAQPLCIPSMRKDDNQKASGLMNTAGGVRVANKVKTLFLQQPCHSRRVSIVFQMYSFYVGSGRYYIFRRVWEARITLVPSEPTTDTALSSSQRRYSWFVK